MKTDLSCFMLSRENTKKSDLKKKKLKNDSDEN